MQKLRHNWKKLYNHEVEVLYQPRISNLESGDAFCNELILIGLQEKPPVKATGLKDIVQAYTWYPVASKNLTARESWGLVK